MDVSRYCRKEIVALLVVCCGLVAAEQDQQNSGAAVRKALESRFPDLKILDVSPAPVSGLYEVFTGLEIAYTDKSANYLIRGSIIDARTKEDLTEQRLDDLNAIRFESLPFDKAIKIVKGSGARKLAVFSDPDCPFCRRLEEEMKSMSDITVYVFLYPLKIHPKAADHAKAIWCSNNPTQVWAEWMLEQKEPAGATCETDPVGDLQKLGEALHINGTPTLYFENGRRTAGALPKADLEARLAEATAARK